MANPQLVLSDCHVSYGPIPALRGIDVEIHAGEMVSLLGANGAGKTTTLRAVSGLLHPRRGWISFEGERIDTLATQEVVSRGIAHVPEGRDLFPGLSVQDNLRYGYWPRRKDRQGYKPQLDEIFSAFPKLKERSRQKAGTLSGGEQQQLAIGMALMSRPKLLLIDELSLGLAPKIVATIFKTLRAVNARGTTILLVEQFIPLALANTARAYVLAKGQVALMRASRELEEDPAILQAYFGEPVEPSPSRTTTNFAGQR